MKIKIDLSNLPEVVNKKYFPLLKDKSRYLVLYGGAGSGKSFFAGQKIIYRVLIEKNHRFLVVRKVGRTNRDSTFQLLKSIIYRWGLRSLCRINRADLRISFPLFNSEILFTGMDDAEKIKSIAGITGIWLEEASEFKQNDFQQLDLRLRGRTKNYKQIILSFNPISATHWIKRWFFDRKVEGGKICHSTYKDNRFIDKEYKKRLEALKEIDRYYYQVYCLGEWGVLGNLIFSNWRVIDTNKDLDWYDDVRFGVDFGFNNPSVVLLVGKKENDVYIIKELYQSGLTNKDLINKIKQRFSIEFMKYYFYCDGAEPNRIEEMKREGIKALPVKKGKDSVLRGVDWLKMRKIYIDESCINTQREFEQYKYKEDREGNVLEEPVKEFDHTIDALRYSMNDYINLADKKPMIREL